MVTIERILCPIDFSDPSRHALAHAAAIAAWYEARLTVLHVFAPVPIIDSPASFGHGGMPPVVLRDVDRGELLETMRQFVAPVQGQAAVELQLQEAPDARAEILAQAGVLKADLIVMGAHGRTGIERLLLGSVTEKVLRKARRPVLVVPRQAQEPATGAAPPFKRILCAIDFSPSSERALDYALDLAQEADARLTLLHSIEMPPELGEVPAHGHADVDALRAAVAADALRRLRALVPEEAHTYCTVETVVTDGRAHRQILARAQEEAADVIVMGVQGRSAMDLMFFGSNTHAVIRQAACPVLTIPAA